MVAGTSAAILAATLAVSASMQRRGWRRPQVAHDQAEPVARNQVVSGTFVAAKTVPGVGGSPEVTGTSLKPTLDPEQSNLVIERSKSRQSCGCKHLFQQRHDAGDAKRVEVVGIGEQRASIGICEIAGLRIAEIGEGR